MPPDPDRLNLQRLIAAGVEGLTPELLRYLPRPLAAPRQRTQDERAAASGRSEMDAETAEASEKERAAGQRAATEAQSYLISDELLHAVQVALLLRQPLLLTGDPGVGKTRFARALAGRLGAPLERIDVKTTTTGRDLLYTIDDIARFRDASVGRTAASAPEKTLKDYVLFQGLGKAVLRSAGPKHVVEPKIPLLDVAGKAYAGQTSITLEELFPDAFRRFGRSSGRRGHTVVLIDELDKAPRDTPNDLLVEIEDMMLNIRELGIEVQADPYFWPILIITSNSERSLPDPFLRRCIFHHLKLDNTILPQIVAAQLPDLPSPSPLAKSVIELFLNIRTKLSLDKTPSTAELVGTLALLVELGFDPATGIDVRSAQFQAACPQIAAALGKITADKAKIEAMLTKT